MGEFFIAPEVESELVHFYSGSPSLALSLVYSTAEYCVPPCCRRAYYSLLEMVTNNALRTVTEPLRSTSTNNHSVFSAKQHSVAHGNTATLQLVRRDQKPEHLLHQKLFNNLEKKEEILDNSA